MNKKNITLIKIGKNIKRIRTKEKLSQEELAFKAKLHRTYIGSVERGEKNVTVLNLVKIADALNIEPSVLLKINRKGEKSE